MGVADRVADHQEQPQPIGHGQPARVGVAVDRLAGHVLHDQVGQAVVGGAAVEQPGDVAVFQPRQDLPLVAELPHPLGVEQAAHHLDRHLLQELVVVALGEIDGAHPALAEHRDDAIGAEPFDQRRARAAVTSSTARLTTSARPGSDCSASSAASIPRTSEARSASAAARST